MNAICRAIISRFLSASETRASKEIVFSFKIAISALFSMRSVYLPLNLSSVKSSFRLSAYSFLTISCFSICILFSISWLLRSLSLSSPRNRSTIRSYYSLQRSCFFYYSSNARLCSKFNWEKRSFFCRSYSDSSWAQFKRSSVSSYLLFMSRCLANILLSNVFWILEIANFWSASTLLTWRTNYSSFKANRSRSNFTFSSFSRYSFVSSTNWISLFLNKSAYDSYSSLMHMICLMSLCILCISAVICLLWPCS